MFGQQPNKSNLRELFQSEAIQNLWHSPDKDLGNPDKKGFKDSSELKAVLNQHSAEELKKVINNLQKIAPAGFDIL